MKEEHARAAALLSAEQAARVYGISERTFHELRRKGLVPAPVELGPRLLRWVRTELEAGVAALPRQAAPAPMPSQLRARIEAIKRGVRA
jgi:predicted DNA-binding transcriptional regulator AlpA